MSYMKEIYTAASEIDLTDDLEIRNLAFQLACEWGDFDLGKADATYRLLKQYAVYNPQFETAEDV